MPKKRRRTDSELLADLGAELEAVKRRAERKKAQRDPVVNHVMGVVRAVGRALDEAGDQDLRGKLGEARAALDVVLVERGVPKAVHSSTGSRRRCRPAPDWQDPADSPILLSDPA